MMVRLLTVIFLWLGCLVASPAGRVAAAPIQVPCWINVPAGEAAACYRISVPVYGDGSAQHFCGPGTSFFHNAYPEQVNTDFLWTMTAPVRETRDVVIHDQRGVGLAEPALNCFEIDDKAAAAPAPPGVETPFFDRGRNEIARCYDRLVADGVDPANLSTPANADDLAHLITGLGYEKANLWAMSYGTLVTL